MHVKYQIGCDPIAARPAMVEPPALPAMAEPPARPAALTSRPARRATSGQRSVKALPRKAPSKAPRSCAASSSRLVLHTRMPAPGVAAAVLLAVAGCASVEPMSARTWRIDPVLEVRHSAAAAPGYYAMGRYHGGMQAWSKAVDAYRQAIAAEPTHAEAHNALGVALAQLGRHDEAELALRAAVAAQPERAHLRSNLGYVMLLAGRPREALVELRTAVKLDPDDAAARGNLREAASRWEDLQARQTQLADVQTNPAAETVAVRADIPAEMTATVHARVDRPAEASAAAHEPPRIAVVMAASVTAADLAVPMVTRADAAPLTVMVALSPHTVRVFDQPTVAAWPRADASTPFIERESEVASAVVTSALTHQPVPAAAVPAVADAVDASTADTGLRLELSNGNGVAGMAARLGQWLARQGVQASRLSNQRPFVQAETVVEYRSGHEAAARRVAQALPLATRAVPVLRKELTSDVRIVLGRDWRSAAACMERNACPMVATVVATVSPSSSASPP